VSRRRLPPLLLGALLLAALPALLLWSLRTGVAGGHDAATLLRGVLAAFGADQPLAGTTQTIVELRLWRALTTAGVGAALALSGALLQGLFRNPLASPSVLGVTSGASLGATLAILALGGYGPLLFSGASGSAAVLVPAAGFVGAAGVVTLVVLLAGAGGRVSVPALLLLGLAVNTCLAGLLALISALVLADWEVSRAILAWTFGSLEDRAPQHAATVWVGLLVAVVAVPFVAWELDLLAAGEDDARALGVHTGRVRRVVVLASSLSAAAAVAVSGQIAFVGLVAPHLVRLLSGRAHRALLPLSALLGACFLLGVDTAQRALLGASALPPGVAMSLVGGPFFLGLLLAHRKELDTW
jgi:iron complex transport system permease protein